MTDRASARHRATQRAATPLSTLTSAVSEAVTEHVGNLGRGGVVIAMSSGLVATMGLPAQAVTKATPLSAPLDASLDARLDSRAALAGPVATLTLDTSFLAVPAGLSSSAPVAAPATATVAFDTSGFTAKKAAPKPAAVRVTSRSSRSSSRVLPQSVAGSGVLAIASRYFGVPYRWGGSTPAGFDCSGFTSYVFRQAGISLPRTANQQMLATRRIPRSQAVAGDLVFFVSGGRAYHTGIYVGGNYMYDAPRSGSTVGRHVIWTSSVVFGRP